MEMSVTLRRSTPSILVTHPVPRFVGRVAVWRDNENRSQPGILRIGIRAAMCGIASACGAAQHLMPRIRLTAFMTVNTFGLLALKNQLNAAEKLSPSHSTPRWHTARAGQDDSNVFQKQLARKQQPEILRRFTFIPRSLHRRGDDPITGVETTTALLRSHSHPEMYERPGPAYYGFWFRH